MTAHLGLCQGVEFRDRCRPLKSPSLVMVLDRAEGEAFTVEPHVPVVVRLVLEDGVLIPRGATPPE